MNTKPKSGCMSSSRTLFAHITQVKFHIVMGHRCSDACLIIVSCKGTHLYVITSSVAMVILNVCSCTFLSVCEESH